MKKKQYSFSIVVLEGAPGYCDESRHNSDKFDNLEKCIEECKKFVPYWHNLRCIQYYEINYFTDGKLIKSEKIDNFPRVL